MLQTSTFQTGNWIGPDIPVDWIETAKAPIYWVARKVIDLPGAVHQARVQLAVDRHYDLFVNGGLVKSRRGFFSGDQYLFSDTVDDAGTWFRSGENTVEAVVRSDPFLNKNYRPFHPGMILEASVSCEEGKVSLATDRSWEIAVIEGWRELIAIGGNGTIIFEKVRLAPRDEARLSGFSRKLQFGPAKVLEEGLAEKLSVYEWRDRPKREDIYAPIQTMDKGRCLSIESAMVFNLKEIADRRGSNEPIVLTKRFDCSEEDQLDISTSARIAHRIDLNGGTVYENQVVYKPECMSLPCFMIPAGGAKTARGANRLEIEVHPRLGLYHEMEWQTLRLGFRGVIDPEGWEVDGETIPVEVQELSLAEKISSHVRLGGDDNIVVRGDSVRVPKGGEGLPFAVVDFGDVVAGTLHLRVEAESPGRLILAYGFDYRDNYLNCSKMFENAVDILEVPAGDCDYLAFEARTFRHLQLIFEGFNGDVTVSGIALEEKVYLEAPEVTFETDDPLVDRIWEVARRTSVLNCCEIYMDNPEREHAQWMDCTVGNVAGGYYAFGEYSSPGRALQEFTITQQEDGQLAGYAPGRWFPRQPLQCHMSLFVVGAWRHFMHTGDETFAHYLLDTIGRMIRHWERHRTRDGLIANLDTLFVDWGSHLYSYSGGKKEQAIGVLTTMNSYYHGALVKAQEMAKFLGRVEETEEYGSIASALREAINTHLFDEEEGMYRDGIDNPLAERLYSQTGNALAVKFGVAPEEKRQEIMKNAFANRTDIRILPASAHFSRQAASALFEAGCDELALGWLKRGFGNMLDAGATTFWEVWEDDASQCQGTSSSPVFLFSRYLAGFFPLEPGYRRIGVDPHASGLERLAATLTTPHGLVKVSWERKTEGLDYSLSLPEALRDVPVAVSNPEGVKVRLSVLKDG